MDKHEFMEVPEGKERERNRKITWKMMAENLLNMIKDKKQTNNNNNKNTQKTPGPDGFIGEFY